MMRKNKAIRYSLLTLILLINGFSLAQSSAEIRGTITDKKTGIALPGANVQILGTVKGSSCDLKGKYAIDQLPPGLYTIRISMISYRTLTEKGVLLQPGQQKTIDFQLEETPIEFDPIVVLAGKTKQRLDEAPVSISVVTTRDLERRNPTNLIEALESAPGIHFIGDQINIRGSSGYTFGVGNKVLLLLDGVPVYASDTGQFNWDMLPPLDIEHIEVLKGAGSTLWGASALGGVVNVITKDPAPQGKLMCAWSGGIYDKPYYSEWEWAGQSGAHYNRFDASYSRRFRQLGVQMSLGSFTSTGYQQLGDFEKYNITTKLDYRFKNSIHWTVYSAFSFIDRGFFVQWKGPNEPYEVDETNLDNHFETNQLNLYTKLAIPVSPTFAINLRASMVRSLMGNQFGEGDSFKPAIGQGAELQAHWIPAKNHTISIGTQYQMDTGSTEATGDHKGYFIGPYLQDEWKLRENLRTTLGFRYDRYQLVDGLKEDLFSPRFGINWQPWSTTSFRASVGSGFRAATIIERFLELSIMNFKIIKNEDLKAESSWAYDIGWRQYLTENWNIDVSLFDNEYTNLIEAHLDLIRGQIQFRNLQDVRIQGIELTSNMAWPFIWLNREWQPGLQLSCTAMDHEDLKWHEPLNYRPKLIGTIKMMLQTGNLEFQTDFRYASRIEEVKIYPINERVPMKFWDLRFAYTWQNLKFQLGINNLLQYNYAPMESNLMPPRTFTAGLQGAF